MKKQSKKVFLISGAVIIAGIIVFLFWANIFKDQKTDDKSEAEGFEFHNDGSVTLEEGYVTHGFYGQDGALVNTGGIAVCEGAFVKGSIEFQQNKQVQMEYGLIIMTDFEQKKFWVHDQTFDCYRFSLSGVDKETIDVKIPIESSTYEIEYLIVPEPESKNFSMDSEVGWNNFNATKDVCSSSFCVASKDGGARMPHELEQIDTRKLKLLDFEGNTGFELVKSSMDLSVFDSANAADHVCLCLGGMQKDVKAYAVVAFCDWKQVGITEGELVRCYSSVADQNYFDEIILPNIKDDAVYQMFAFEMPIECRVPGLLKQTFRIKIGGIR